MTGEHPPISHDDVGEPEAEALEETPEVEEVDEGAEPESGEPEAGEAEGEDAAGE